MPTRSIVGGVANTGAAGQASAKTGSPPEWSMCACVKRIASTRVSASIDRSGSGLDPEYRTPQSTTNADPATRTRVHDAPIELAPPKNEISMEFGLGMESWIFAGDAVGPGNAENDPSPKRILDVGSAVFAAGPHFETRRGDPSRVLRVTMAANPPTRLTACRSSVTLLIFRCRRACR